VSRQTPDGIRPHTKSSFVDHLIEIAFKGKAKSSSLGGRRAAAVCARGHRRRRPGEDLGRVYATGELAQKRAAGVPHAPRPDAETARGDSRRRRHQRHDELRPQDEVARRRAMERVKANNLLMKLSDAEWQWDRRKLTIYFTAEKRVDFRNLVRDLAALFRRASSSSRSAFAMKRTARRHRSLRARILLCVVAAGASPGEPRRREGSAAVAEPRADLRCVRAAHVLSTLRARVLRPEPQAISEGSKDLVTARGEEKVVSNDIFNERVTLRNVEGENAGRVAGRPQARNGWRLDDREEPVVEEERT
jgi:hypothetical protein